MLKTADADGRIALGQKYAGHTFDITERDDGALILVPADAIPEDDLARKHLHPPIDKNSTEVRVGSLVRVLSLSGEWFDALPEDEKADVESMIGEVFEVE